MACLLSIIVISHNQKEQLRRCIDSILAQDLPFEHEIIVSDDASTDGTWELIQEYVTRYHGIIKGYQCNSNDCNPDMMSERAGFNRINGLKHSIGKYLIHIDADDFYDGRTCIQKQVEFLEKNIDCSICFQNYKWKEDDEPEIPDKGVFGDNLFFDGNKLTVDSFIHNIPYIHNSACCMVNNINSIKHNLSSQSYDDVDITFHHIQKGKVILISNADFIYCHHHNNSASNFQKLGQTICWLTCVSNSLIAPQCIGSLLREGIGNILDILNYGKKEVLLDDCIVSYLSKCKAFIFNYFDNKFQFKNKIRLNLARIWIKIILKLNLDSDIVYIILYCLVISFSIPKSAFFERLK